MYWPTCSGGGYTVFPMGVPDSATKGKRVIGPYIVTGGPQKITEIQNVFKNAYISKIPRYLFGYPLTGVARYLIGFLWGLRWNHGNTMCTCPYLHTLKARAWIVIKTPLCSKVLMYTDEISVKMSWVLQKLHINLHGTFMVYNIIHIHKPLYIIHAMYFIICNSHLFN